MNLYIILGLHSESTSDQIILGKLLRTLQYHRASLPELQKLDSLIAALPTPGRKNLATEALLSIVSLLNKHQQESEVYRKLYRLLKADLFLVTELDSAGSVADTYLTEEYIQNYLYSRQHPWRARLKRWLW